MAAVTYNKFDVSNISFGNVKEFKNGSKSINIHFPDGNIQFIQTPKDIVPFHPYDDNFCFSVNDSFKKKLIEIEDYIIKNASQNSSNWFGSSMTEDDIRGNYFPILQQNNPDFPPFMRISFSNNNEIYGIDNQLTDKGNISARSMVKLIVKFGKIYIRGNDKKMKMVFYLEQAKIFDNPKVNKLKSYAFIDSEDEE